MIEIKKEKYCKIGVKCGTRQKLIRIVEQWKGDMIWCLRIFSFFFCFYFLFSCVKITFSFNQLESFFLSFSCVRLRVPVHGNLGGVRGGRCPLSPPSGSATATNRRDLREVTSGGEERERERERNGRYGRMGKILGFLICVYLLLFCE